MPNESIILKWAAAWHCLPSQVLEEPYEPYAMIMANRWGVRPSQVLEEDVIWVKRQELLDRMEEAEYARSQRKYQH